MASATLSALAGSLLSPLRDISLEKLIGYLWNYLSSSPSPSSSSSDESEKQQQKLKDSLEALEDAKMNVKMMQSRIMKLFEKHKQNERVVGLHNKLKDVGYDIQDLESDMKYMELERKVKEIKKADQEADTSTSQSSRRLKRLFHCSPHSSKKNRRLSTSSQSSSLSTDDDILTKITSIINQINVIESKLGAETTLDEWFDQLHINQVYDPYERVTTSSTNERVLYGRHDEIQRLIELLKGPNVNGNISVIPIVGMGGISKTTLAQFVFNNREVENHFDEKGWICASDDFDRFRITKQIVEIISPNFQWCSTTNLDLLERQLKRHLTRKKFLLVLDNLWSDKWQQLLAPLQSTQAEDIKIIVICRDPTVLRSIDREIKITLEGLCDVDYWSFFVNIAFGGNNPDNYSQALHDIGKCIVEKLKGSPLAAKTVGKILAKKLTEEHWKHVLESDMWKLETDVHDIMPALALSYYHLPQHLQLCFVFCSLFPKNHFYDMDDLISMWIANGYIHESGSCSKTLNDVGKDYCYELLEMCFFYIAEPSPFIQMHDLMHDLAQLVSHGEICIYKSGVSQNISKNVHHLNAEGLIDHGLVCEATNLRTVVLKIADEHRNGFSHRTADESALSRRLLINKKLADYTSAFLNHEACKRIRILVIVDFNMQEFPNAICHLKYLQYLDLKSTGIYKIPESLCGLYQLKVLLLPYPQTLPSQFHNLINLQKWCMFRHKVAVINGELVYHVKRDRGYVIAQLQNMNELRRPLSIDGLENVDNMKEAMKAKLKEKRHLKCLGLFWNHRVDRCKHHVQEEVLEGLQPHTNLERLRIGGYMASKTPSWLMTPVLQKLQSISLIKCRNWACLPTALGLLPSLEELHLNDIENITVQSDGVNEMFSSLRRLELTKATVSIEGMPTPTASSSLTTPGRFRNLQYLSVKICDGGNGLHWLISPALKELCIRHSPALLDQLPGCLYGLSSLTRLELSGPKIKTFPADMMTTLYALQDIVLDDVSELLSLEGLQALPSLGELSISRCPKFKSWCVEEMTKLHKISIRSCQDLESLPAWLHCLLLLKDLSICYCPKFCSLPESGLPVSLETLDITDCDPSLRERCQQEQSREWQMIQHIRKVYF